MAEIITYVTARGNSEVEDELDKLNSKARKGDERAAKALDSIIYSIEKHGEGMPHSRQLRGPLYEIRAGRYRITYFRWQGKLVLLTIFFKRTQQTPPREIERAEERMRDWVNRHGK